MKSNAPGILLATLLVYVARALFFQKNFGLLDNSLIALVFGLIALVLKYGIKYAAKLMRKEVDYEKISARWTSNLVFGLIVGMAMVNLDGLSNMELGTPTLYLFFGGPIPAAIVIGVCATAFTFAKNRGQIPSPRLYAITSLIVTAFLIIAFVYAGSNA